MFTGIVEAVGKIAAIAGQGGDRRCTIEAPAGFLRGCRPGDSIAVAGICLTLARRSGKRFLADVSRETLAATTAELWQKGDAVNLEKALTLERPLGGHLVSGHVDGVGRLQGWQKEARSRRLNFVVPGGLARYLARKGSVCVDGVSLTINQAAGHGFSVNIVPHTLAHTTLGRLQTGDGVNIEVDLVARYLERLIAERNG